MRVSIVRNKNLNTLLLSKMWVSDLDFSEEDEDDLMIELKLLFELLFSDSED
jgi:hypothetical protein